MAATLYFAAFTSANTPTWARADIANGRHGFSSTGYAASGSTTTGVPTSGSGNDQSVGITLSGLSAGTAYKIWLIWDDGTSTSNSGSPVVSAEFWTLDPQTVSVPAGALTLTGYAPTVVAISGQVVDVPAGALTLTGYAPTVLAPVSVAVPAGGLTLTGYAPTVLGTLVTPDAPTRRGGGISRFVEARKRLPMPFLVDWLTNAEPTEATKRVIREVKAGRPIPHDVKPPKGPENISPARLAREILPERAYAFDTWLSDMIITSRAVEKAVQIALEHDDEEVLLLL